MSQRLRRAFLLTVPLLLLGGALGLRLTGWAGIAGTVRMRLFEFYGNFAPFLSLDGATRPVWADQAEILYLGIGGLVLVFLIAWEQIGIAGVLGTALIAGAALFSVRVLADQHFLLDAAYPSLSFALIYGAGMLANLATGARERERMRRSLATHLPPSAMARIGRNPEVLNLAGETRTMTYLVCGIRGFSQLAESFNRDPEGLARLTRRAMTPLAKAILDRQGAIDRVLPGGLSAFFNAPFDDPEHAVHACECALRMIEAMEKINQAQEQERRGDGTSVPSIELGIGIATGPGVVGDFGTHSRPEYSVAGRAAELASQIQLLSGRYGPAVVVADATRTLAERNFAFLEVDLIVPQGGNEPTPLFALLGNPLLRASPKFRALKTFHEHIFQAYRAQDWEKAKGLIEQCRALSGASSTLYDLYLARIAYYEKQPPGANWNGVFRVALAG